MSTPWNSDELIRAELFSAERLEQHAESLAVAQRVAKGARPPVSLSRRLADSSRLLRAAYHDIASVIDEGYPITPAAEWLIDNFHVVEDQIREIRDDLPPSFYKQLPKLADGPLAGYPRVFGLAWAFVAHTDSRFDAELLRRFVAAYQRVQPLTIGELWAVAISLRIVLVENLRRSAERIVSGRAARLQADEVANRLLGIDGSAPEPISAVLRAYEQKPLSRAFAVQLVQRLRDQDPRVTPALHWLDERLAAQSTTAEQLVQSEIQRQGAMNVTVRNAITSMRHISAIDWGEIFESISLVDAAFTKGSEFARMDFPTRNRYRRAVEELARGSKRTELEIAERALEAAQQARAAAESAGDEGPRRDQDPGFYLVGSGRWRFEEALGYRAPIHTWLGRISASVGIRGYLGTIGLITSLVLSLALLEAAPPIGGWAFGLLALVGLLPAMDAAVALVNRGATNRFSAHVLPGLELRGGIPPELRTLVVVPTLLTNPEALEEQLARLEIHHLASADGELYFALLSDWTDADAESVAGDAVILAAAREGIARLNRRYGPGPTGDRFFLLHRKRLWNGAQGKWMGWERKRGKLHELNRLLRGATDTTFVAIDGQPPAVPDGVRYVITLDADTRLPREAARRLVGKMAHPLNHARFDARVQRVTEGYAVLQPRVTASLPIGSGGSLFQHLFSTATGIDPYSGAVSDVYQDLLGEGSYIGKGIYDVDAFELALAGRVPENTLLSHDLFEGIFARAGLVSDIELVEEYPSRYDVAASRHHRWARGDWQLLPWLLGRGAFSSDVRRAIPLIGRWKMLDNLRRTLSAPASFTALLAGWLLPPHAAQVWTAFVVLMIALPVVLPVLGVIAPTRSGLSWRNHLRALLEDAWLALCQTAVLVALLPHQSWLMMDAVVRTVGRLFVTRRNLLEWVTAAQTTAGPLPDLRGFYRQMAGGVALGVGAALLVAERPPEVQLLAAPFVLAWLLAPAVALFTSLPPRTTGREAVTAKDARFLRAIARRTWRFFETFVTPDDHMLPPDNFQEDPKPVVAHRTSPTNLGLALLSAVSARDFGWIGTVDLVDRLEATLATMGKLERHRGHFYNWYDTTDLRTLDPKYLSSVDSGNLAGHLIALANACRERIALPLADVDLIAGIEDSLELTREAVHALPDDRRMLAAARQHLHDALDGLEAALRALETTPWSPRAWITGLAPHAHTIADIARALAEERDDDASAEILYWAEATQRTIESHRRDLSAIGLESRLSALEATARALVAEMDFGFLFDTDRKLLSIGYLPADGALDPSCYDLLASEARLASFVAIAKGDIPARHWFRLGRAITPTDRGAALISWSGSMFEYLMPSLVMRAPTGSLLEQTNDLIVRRQIAYAGELGLPWGISESAYNARDLELTYQYSNFGVPSLGLKRGLAENAVVAPYATALATMVDPGAAVRNFKRLVQAGALGRYGFYEALDYTPTRLPEGRDVAIVRAYMAHHQGMTVVAIANTLLEAPMRRRFHTEPIVQATELLLQERTPRDVSVAHPRAEHLSTDARSRELSAPKPRRFRSAHDPTPRTNLLSNGRYAVMLTAAGSGYSRWHGLAITRWREDVTRDDFGAYVFLRDVGSGEVWSAGWQPAGVEPSHYEAVFCEDRASIHRHDGELATTLEVLISPEVDAEVRRVTITNSGHETREIELTSYAELALAPPAADLAHPAFSKLFVQTEQIAELGAILATRRRRAPEEAEVWAAHLSVAEGETVGKLELETDRARFLGRGHGIRAPIAVIDGRPLSNTVGTVLDPIFSLRRRVRIAPGATARVAFWTLVAPTRAEVLDLVDKHQDTTAFERASTLAWTQAQVLLRHLGIDSDDANLFQELANHVLYADPSLRPSSEGIARGAGAQPGLWAQGISGDLPIVLVRIDESDELGIVRELLRAHEYWRMKQLEVDLVILNEKSHSYVQDLQVALETLVRISQSRPKIVADATRGAVFVARADLISAETRALLRSVARAELFGRRGSLAEQLDRLREREPGTAVAARSPARAPSRTALPPADLEFYNGLGGFAAGGREYVTVLGEGQWTPAPWINVVANPSFGFQVSAEGGGSTWAGVSRENQLTPWSNDPVSDPPGEVLYVRDEDSGELWGPTALPIRDASAPYESRHGRGFSRFAHTAHGIELDLVSYVPLEDPLKLSRLGLRNLSGRTRRLSVTAYVEWVLGTTRSATAPFVVTEIDRESGALFARNPWNAEFGERVAFADLLGRQTAWTADRREFLGRNGTLDAPAALADGAVLSNRTGAGLDPCGALQTSFELRPNSAIEIVFVLGQASSSADARALVARYRSIDLDAVLERVTERWDEVLGAIQVKTPDRALDILLNHWLLYQTLACRIWARSGFYQASGAYGFRDQLQDGMALVTARPDLTREHLLRAAARQFVPGDVQHWWLPISGKGVRTRFSDDRVWLPYAVAQYVAATGDRAVLDEPVPFLEGAVLEPHESEAFFEPTVSAETASLFEHCARALDLSLAVGERGLPLFGAGDWNDGMNRVGVGGRGESVWLGWFVDAAIADFAPLADARGEHALAERWRTHAVALRAALERNGWDGAWYRRGFFDDGTPLGSATSDECRIDSIAQSWSVISGAADPHRAERAMAAVESQLILPRERLALLFTPPFDRTPLDPGYIKGYPPGIRENGGQYTHAALWSVIAFALQGDGDRAAGLWSMLNPIHHSATRAGARRYKTEPYAVAADIYSVAPHVGRGGWTWYTGSAAWMYRAALEWILGFRVRGDVLELDPCVPKGWPGFELSFFYGSARYEISVANPNGVSRGTPTRVPLTDDGVVHPVRIVLG